ncbi:hypothetical protein R1sor_027456 [Riccia sorocarpa]|uniref:Sigma factor n=1 Tax=Riccia sorocarpa TaxID=122646 RepID=A0ABD3GEA4_9MARC
MERVGRISSNHPGGIVQLVNAAGGTSQVATESNRAALTRLPVTLSTIVIDRLPKAGLRIGRLRRRSSSLTRISVVAAASIGTLDDVKRAKKLRGRKTNPAPDTASSAAPLSAANTKNLASTDKELLKLAQALENAYFQDSLPSSLPSLPPNSTHASLLEDLITQVRPFVDVPVEYAAPSSSTSTSTSSSNSARTALKKKRGRKLATSVEHLPQQSQMDAPQGSINGNHWTTGGGSSPSPRPVRTATEGEAAGKRRLNLVSRIALRRGREEMLRKKKSDTNAKAGRSGQDIWSEDAQKLIDKYSTSLDFGVVDWDSLSRDLLTSEQEYNLSVTTKPWKQLQKTSKSLSEELGREPSDEELAKAAEVDVSTLRRQIALGRAARNKLIQHNLRLVLFQAHKYQKDNSSLSLFDLCQEGVSGLLHAVDKFDPKRGHRFSTYAVYWVRNSILRALTRAGSMVRSPYNVAMHKWNIKRARLDLLMELGRAPTDEEVRERMGLAPDRYRDILRSSVGMRSIHERSLVTGEELAENIADSQTDDSRRSTGETVLKDMEPVLHSLKPKESFVLSQRFGLDGKGERTLSEIGKNMNLSREMVRRYEACGLLKMKEPKRLEYLRNYLSNDD